MACWRVHTAKTRPIQIPRIYNGFEKWISCPFFAETETENFGQQWHPFYSVFTLDDIETDTESDQISCIELCGGVHAQKTETDDNFNWVLYKLYRYPNRSRCRAVWMTHHSSRCNYQFRPWSWPVWPHYATFWVVFSVLASSHVNKVQDIEKWFKWFYPKRKWALSPSMENNINSSLMPFDWVQTLTSGIRYIRCPSTVIAIGEQVLLQFTCVISNNIRKIDVSEQDWFQLHHVNSHKSLFVG